MKEHPIIFSAPMVRANHAGRKWMTRRVVKPPFEMHANGFLTRPDGHGGRLGPYPCPYGASGDRIWVRERWATSIGCDGTRPAILETPGNGYGWPVWFAADDAVWWRGASQGGSAFVNRGRWRASFHMPRWACRDVYTVTKVRVERLQAITREDAIAEGVGCCVELPETETPCTCCGCCLPEDGCGPVQMYRDLWDALNGKRPGCSWADNPWVWVIEYDNPAVPL